MRSDRQKGRPLEKPQRSIMHAVAAVVVVVVGELLLTDTTVVVVGMSVMVAVANSKEETEHSWLFSLLKSLSRSVLFLLRTFVSRDFDTPSLLLGSLCPVNKQISHAIYASLLIAPKQASIDFKTYIHRH